MGSTQAGTLLLIGQIIDGLTTPLVGLGIGKGKGKALCCGRPYKGWHIIGTICTILGFPALFLPCFGCEKYGQWGILLWYGTFVALAQIGWAIVQISHMALIPILAKTDNQRIEISSYKNAAGFVASIVVYSIAWLVFDLHTDASSVGEGNSKEFYLISFLCHGLGIVCSIIFWFGVTEEKQRDEVILTSLDALPAQANQSLVSWFRKRAFYTNLIVFTCGRLFGNLAQVYLPMYLQVTLSLPPMTLATVPMTLYISGFFTSMLVKWIRNSLDPVILLWSAITIGFVSSAGIWFGEGYIYDTYLIYFVAVLFGASGSIMFIISLASTANFIGDDVKSSGFVYGVYSLSDKILNGVVVFVIQYIHPERDSPFCGEFYRWVLPIVCSVSLAIALSTQFGPIFTKRKGYKIEETISISTKL